MAFTNCFKYLDIKCHMRLNQSSDTFKVQPKDTGTSGTVAIQQVGTEIACIAKPGV